jgi:tetratricopeptide (TPR) repeat protein
VATSATGSRPRIGRLDTWEALVYRRERARSGLGGITLLEGPLGVGKSTFLRAQLEDAKAGGFRTFYARAADENPPPFSMIRNAIVPEPSFEGRSAPPASPTAGPSLTFLPGLLQKGGESLSGEAIRTAADGTQAELESERQRLSAEFAEPLLTAARTGPVLLALDDLHRADPASIEFLQYLASRISGKPVWVLATFDLPGSEAPAGPFETFLKTKDLERVSLAPLSESELTEFLHWLEPTRRFRETEVRRLYSETGGLPMFVDRLVHQGPAQMDAEQASEEGAKDDDARLRGLDATTRRLLNLAVVAGNEFAFDVLAAAAGGEEEQVVEGLERLVGLGVLRELEWDRFAFTEEDFRHRLFASLSAPTVRNLHRRIAAALEQSGSREMETVYALARHSYLGGLDAAVKFNRQAAEFAVAQFQPSVAIAYLEHALEALHRVDPDDVAAETRLRLELAMQRTRTGELQTAETLLKEFRTDRRLWNAATSVDRALYSLLRARLLADQGRWEEAERSFQDLPAAGPSSGSVTLRIATLRLRGEILFYRGSYNESLAAHAEALRLATEAGDLREAAAESVRRATVLSMLPEREEEALADFRSAVDKLVAIGDRAEAAFGLLCLGAQLSHSGHPAEAREALQQAFELSEAAHDVRRLGWTCLNLADLELAQGQPQEAEARNRVALSLFEQIGDSLGRARAFLTEGRLALGRGDVGAAEKEFTEARAIFEEQGLEADELEVDLREVEVQLVKEDRGAALRLLERLREQGLERLRPDLVAEWHRLRHSLSVR